MSALWPGLEALLLFVSLVVLAIALTAPFETLRWWGADHRLTLPRAPRPQGDPQAPSPAHRPRCYVVYLTGIGGSGEDLARRERGFIERLAARVPEAEMLTDVFPFSVTNDPLTGERPLSWLWRLLHRARLNTKSLLFEFWIGARNVCQVAVCSDPRYGPIYNLGLAREVYASLLSRGYDPRARTPIVLIGYSGGAQVALGAACYLTRLPSPVTVVTIGGVFSSIPGIALAHQVHCLVGSRDKTLMLGPLMFPGRWPWMAASHWNRALREGKVSIHRPGPMIHSGRGDYFTQSVTLPNGTSYADHTADIVADIVGDCAKPERTEGSPPSPEGSSETLSHL